MSEAARRAYQSHGKFHGTAGCYAEVTPGTQITPRETDNSHASLPCFTQNLKNQHPLLVDHSRIFEGDRQMRPVLISSFNVKIYVRRCT